MTLYFPLINDVLYARAFINETVNNIDCPVNVYSVINYVITRKKKKLFNYLIISMTLYFPLINDVLYARAFM